MQGNMNERNKTTRADKQEDSEDFANYFKFANFGANQKSINSGLLGVVDRDYVRIPIGEK